MSGVPGSPLAFSKNSKPSALSARARRFCALLDLARSSPASLSFRHSLYTQRLAYLRFVFLILKVAEISSMR